MPRVRSRILGPTGAPQPGGRVVAHLVAAPAFLSDHTGQILTPAQTTTDSDGWWELDLTPTEALEDPAAYYVIHEYPPGGGTPTTTTIVVPDTEPEYLLGDLQIPPPG